MPHCSTLMPCKRASEAMSARGGAWRRRYKPHAACVYAPMVEIPRKRSHFLGFPQDMAELEEAVGAHLAPPASLGRPSRALRALLFAGRSPNPHSLKTGDLLR